MRPRRYPTTRGSMTSSNRPRTYEDPGSSYRQCGRVVPATALSSAVSSGTGIEAAISVSGSLNLGCCFANLALSTATLPHDNTGTSALSCRPYPGWSVGHDHRCRCRDRRGPSAPRTRWHTAPMYAVFTSLGWCLAATPTGANRGTALRQHFLTELTNRRVAGQRDRCQCRHHSASPKTVTASDHCYAHIPATMWTSRSPIWPTTAAAPTENVSAAPIIHRLASGTTIRLDDTEIPLPRIPMFVPHHRRATHERRRLHTPAHRAETTLTSVPAPSLNVHHGGLPRP
ncbi:hypothetical protein BH10ACT9_BH10ACT9_46140 [soil metagenome]